MFRRRLQRGSDDAQQSHGGDFLKEEDAACCDRPDAVDIVDQPTARGLKQDAEQRHFAPPHYGVQLPERVVQEQRRFLDSLNPAVSVARILLDDQVCWPQGDRRYFHISGAMACFREQYTQRVSSSIHNLLQTVDTNLPSTSKWLNRIIEVGNTLGELSVATTFIKNDAPDVWSSFGHDIEESQSALEHYIGACIAVLRSSRDRKMDAAIHRQHSEVVALFDNIWKHEKMAETALYFAHAASNRRDVVRRRLDRLVKTLGLVPHSLHGHELYLPDDCVPIVREMAGAFDDIVSGAVRIAKADSWYYSSRPSAGRSDEKVVVCMERGVAGGLLCVEDAASNAKVLYAASIGALGLNIDKRLALSLATDFGYFIDRYAEARFFDKLESGSFKPVVAALEEVLIYHLASRQALFDKGLENALRLQMRLGHDASWVRDEAMNARLLIDEAKQSYSLPTSMYVRRTVYGPPFRPVESKGLLAAQEDPLFAGIEKGMLGSYRADEPQ